MLGGAGSHRRVNGIKSESYSGDINRLSYSHLASLKIEKCENKGDFPGDCQPYLRKCFSYKVSSLNVAPLKAHHTTVFFFRRISTIIYSKSSRSVLWVGKYFFIVVDTQSIVHWKILKMTPITVNNFNATLRSFLAVIQ